MFFGLFDFLLAYRKNASCVGESDTQYYSWITNNVTGFNFVNGV
jgi:hypothetical protein